MAVKAAASGLCFRGDSVQGRNSVTVVGNAHMMHHRHPDSLQGEYRQQK